MKRIIEILTTDLQGGYEGPNWIEISVKDTLTGVSTEKAFWQPPGDVHTIAAIVCHLIVWRKALIDVLENKKDWNVDQEGSFDTAAFGADNEQRWSNIKNALNDTQQRLMNLLDNAEPVLDKKVPTRSYSYRYFISGTIQHDAYHLGQIVLLAKQANNNP
ncbi:MAG: DinB family protein [Agriterribacter sp.]